jgi:hypothetical protein
MKALVGRAPPTLLICVLAVYLRQRGSPESKPVGEAHDHTGVTG